MRLSAHFELSEFLVGLRPGTAVPPAVLAALTELARRLEILRAELGGGPVVITSGWRPAWRNLQVGGALNSRHVPGQAADLRVAGRSPTVVATVALNLGIFGGIGFYPSWTHLDTRPRPKGAAPVLWHL